MVTYRQKIDKMLADYRLAESQVEANESELQEAKQDVVDTEVAQSLLQHVAQAIQQRAHDKVSMIVSRCLEAVFDEPYEFRIEFERKRGKTEASLQFYRDGNVIDPLEGGSGGMLQVAAFALRLACLSLVRPRLRKVMVFDESFTGVHVVNLARVKQLLNELSEELDVQFIQVTHINALSCGKIIELG